MTAASGSAESERNPEFVKVTLFLRRSASQRQLLMDSLSETEQPVSLSCCSEPDHRVYGTSPYKQIAKQSRKECTEAYVQSTQVNVIVPALKSYQCGVLVMIKSVPTVLKLIKKT